MRLNKGMGGLLLLSLMCCVVLGQENRIEQLEKKIMSQQQQIQEMEAQLEQKARIQSKELAVQTLREPDLNEPSGVEVGYDDGFFIRDRSAELELKIKGEIMWQAFFHEAHTVQNNTFVLRRNRLDTHLFYKDVWHARVKFGVDQDFEGYGYDVKLRLREAYIEYLGCTYTNARVGITKVPFSMEFWGERTDQLAIAFSPFLTMESVPRRDAGLMIYGKGIPGLFREYVSNYFGYAIGVFNGDGNLTINDADTNSSNDGKVNLNVDDDFMFVANLRLYPFTYEEQNAFFHVAFFYNDTDFRENGARIRLDGLQNHEIYARDLPTGSATEDIDDTNGKQYGVDLGFFWSRDNLRIESELMYITMEREIDHKSTAGITRRRPRLDMLGISGAISYFFSLGDESIGMGIEPLFKASYTTIDDRHKQNSIVTYPLGNVGNIRGQDVWEIVFGTRFHFSKYCRLDFNWVMYDLKETYGFSNNDRGSGGGLMHSFLFQVMARW